MRGLGTFRDVANGLVAIVPTALVWMISGTGSTLAADDLKPALTVIVEGTTILANQTVGVHVWVENSTDLPISSLTLSLAAPSYLSLGELKDGQCSFAKNNTVTVASVLAAHSELPPSNLCIAAGERVHEEDVNVAFALSYIVHAKGGLQTGSTVSEKKLSVGLLGTDTVAGVSLRLIGFFLPGALVLMMLTLGKFPLMDRLSTSDSAIVSVILSIFLSFGLTRLTAPRAPNSVGVSLMALLTVCGVAAGIGAALISGHQWLRYKKRQALRSLLVSDGDDLQTVLLKALKTAGEDFDPVTVARRGVSYVGSAAAKTSTGGVVVLGWFKLTTADPVLRARLKALLDAGYYVQALEQSGDATLSPSNTLREKRDGGLLRGSSEGERIQIPARDKPECIRGWVAGLDIEDPPLILA